MRADSSHSLWKIGATCAIACEIAATIGYPPVAYSIAYWRTSRKRNVPCSLSSISQAPKAPGTHAASRPVPGMSSSPSSLKRLMLAALGAGPWPQMTSTVARRASQRMIGRSPPGPFRWGSTTWRTKPAATAASKALPPRSRIAMPVCEASQCVELTIPKVPRNSGRVVNISAGLGEGVGELALIERVVEAMSREQLGMATLLDDLALIHDDDVVGVADGREAVRDHDAGSALSKSRHRLLDLDLGARVDTAGRLVQDQDGSIGQEGSGDGQQLLLPGGNV